MTMGSSVQIHSAHNSALSLWQSAVHSVLLQQGVSNGHQGIGATASSPAMLATGEIIRQYDNNGNFEVPAVQSSQASEAATSTGEAALAAPRSASVECANLAAQIAFYRAINPAKAAELKNIFAASTCDPFWAECLAVYERFRISGAQQRYDRYASIDDYVLNDCLSDNATIAVIGDWGTGMNAALVLLQQIADHFQPDVLLHLGDIYYSGLPAECSNHFSKLLEEVWPDIGEKSAPLVFTLDGNHDRYAGTSGGYYDLIASLNKSANKPQPNSYFAIRNNFWQFLALDTGFYDCDPNNVNSNVTKLVPEEVAWHLDKIKNNGEGVNAAVNPSGVRRTVLLSHHQLFSFTGVGKDPATGRPLAINPNLVSGFSSVFDSIDLWLWGHEHDLCIFQPYANGPDQPLPRGRCIGASAVPVFTSQAPKAPVNLLLPNGASGPPKIIDGTALGNDGQVFNRCYAIISLRGGALSIDYYQANTTNATPGNPPKLADPLFSETIPGMLAAS